MHRSSSARDLESTYAATRIVKRLSATQAGAIKLAQRYGEALVCVRYRHDAEGRLRYTTVELVVDLAPIAARADPDELVMVRLDFNDAQTRQQALANGARWDAQRHLWCMTRRTAKRLRLVRRIDAMQPP
jgi:hypothetical protein